MTRPQHDRATPRALTSGLAVALAALLVVALLPPAAAEPALDDLEREADEAREQRETLSSEQAEAQARLDELQAEFSTAVEEYNQANAELEETSAEIDRLEGEIGDLVAGMSEREAQVGELVRAMYVSGGDVSSFDAVLGTEGVQETVLRLGYLDSTQRSQRGLIEGYVADATILDREQEELVAARQRQEELTAELDDQRATIESHVADHQDEMDALEAQLADARSDVASADAAVDSREAELAEEAAAEAAAAEEAERLAQVEDAPSSSSGGASDTGSSGGGGGSGGDASGSSGASDADSRTDSGSASRSSDGGSQAASPSGAAGAAVSAAMGQIGTPYVWGGSSPGGFDCSGLTSWSYRQAGVSIPRTSGAQCSGLPRVSRDQLQPGDLLCFGSPVHHIGMYVGGGSMVEAPRTGLNVRTTTINRSGYSGAVRPTG